MVTDLRLGCILTMCLEQGKDQIHSACYMPLRYLILAVVFPERYRYPLSLMSKWVLTEARLAQVCRPTKRQS